MPTINTQDLTGPALDWAVAKAEGLPLALDPMGFSKDAPGSLQAGWWVWPQRGNALVIGRDFAPSTNPAQSHPIIERDGIWSQRYGPEQWCARAEWQDYHHEGIEGPTALIAAMRCHILHRLGPTVDVPQELV